MKKRTLSEFMCIEMLYDYKMGKLDPLRVMAVEESLESSPRAREELKKITAGLSYAEKLKKIKISMPLTEAIASHPKPSQKFISRIGLKTLPQPVRWGLEAAVVAMAIALFVTQAPELFKGESSSLEVRKIETDVAGNNEIEVTPELKEKPQNIALQQQVQQLPPLEQKPKQDIVQEKPKDSVAVTNDLVKKVKPQEAISVVEGSAQTQTPEVVAKTKATKKQGYVYRLVMFVDNVDQVTPQIVQLLESQGGKKAGEVELGWRRKGGSYFHFTVPKANYTAVTEGLKKYSDFNIAKSEHPRVMPEDVERYILWVEERK